MHDQEGSQEVQAISLRPVAHLREVWPCGQQQTLVVQTQKTVVALTVVALIDVRNSCPDFWGNGRTQTANKICPEFTHDQFLLATRVAVTSTIGRCSEFKSR